MSRIIAIGSGKGGVGKTWLAISLGQALGRLGRRVLLFDGDFGLANVDIQLGLGAGPDLGSVLTRRCRLEDAIRPVAAAGFDVVAGRSGSGQLALMAEPVLDDLLGDLDRVAGGYDDVLIDLPAGLDRGVRTILARAALPLAVTTDEPTAITDAYALIKVHRGLVTAAADSRRPGAVRLPAAVRLPGAVRLVVNQAANHQAGRQTYEGLRRVCQHFLDLEPPLAGVLRRDPRVQEAICQQLPFLGRHPLSPTARDVEALARNLVATT